MFHRKTADAESSRGKQHARVGRPRFITFRSSNCSTEECNSLLSFSEFTQQVRRRIQVFPKLQWTQQLIFVFPVICLIVLLSHLNRFDAANRYNRRFLADIQVESLPFQWPTAMTVRSFYNRPPTDVSTDMPHWLAHYVQFHASKLALDQTTLQYSLKPNTPYLLYRWCHQAPHEHSLFDDVARTYSSFSLWRALGFLDQDETPTPVPVQQVSTCRTPQDVSANMDGLLTALYVAAMSDRVLIVQDLPDTPLKEFLDANLIHWDASLPEEISNLPQVSTVKEMEDFLCYRYQQSGSLDFGVEITTKEWLGETTLWTSTCLRKYWKLAAYEHATLKSNNNANSSTNGGFWSLLTSESQVEPQYLYPWGFWCLFTVKDSILNKADMLRKQASLPIAERSSLKVPAFEPYYYGATSGIESLDLQNRNLNKKTFTLARTVLEEQGTLLQCAQNLYEVSLPWTVNEYTSSARHPLLSRYIFLQGKQTAQDVVGRSMLRYNKQAFNMKNRPFGNNTSVWYLDFWSNLVIAVESECLIIPKPTAPVGLLAQKISVTHPETLKRCLVEADRCLADWSTEAKLLQTLPWAKNN